MLSKSQEKLVTSLHTKKGRDASGLCLVEGSKVIETAGQAVEWTFGPADARNFSKLVTTETPQDKAAVARIPEWTLDNVAKAKTIVVLDGVQDPGNVGAILRLCLGFNASLILVESADVTSPKVIRSSVGVMFHVPWMKVSRKDATKTIKSLNLPIYRLEARKSSGPISQISKPKKLVLIAGSEGRGIQLRTDGKSVAIKHNSKLESLNVGHALAIALHNRT